MPTSLSIIIFFMDPKDFLEILEEMKSRQRWESWS